MEAGYDYLLLRSQLQQTFIRTSAIFLIVAGAILLFAGVSYFVYAQVARSNLDKLNFTVTDAQTGAALPLIDTSPPVGVRSAIDASPLAEMGWGGTTGLGQAAAAQPQAIIGVSGVEVMGTISSREIVVSDAGGVNVPGPQTPGSILTATVEPDQVGPVELDPAETVPSVVPQSAPLVQLPQGSAAGVNMPQISHSRIAEQQAFQGDGVQAAYWGNPLTYEPASDLQAALLEGFRPIGPLDAAAVGTLPPPERIIIPSIGVDSAVAPLAILDLGDSRAYETPDHVVGHISERASAGEMGSVWLFGHLESPIAGEGNVFYNLPKIPELLRGGHEVYVVVDNGESSYLYRIVETRVVHQDDMAMFDSGGPTIHLVACVPRFVYDHRLIVTGELVGVRG